MASETMIEKRLGFANDIRKRRSREIVEKKRKAIAKTMQYKKDVESFKSQMKMELADILNLPQEQNPTQV